MIFIFLTHLWSSVELGQSVPKSRSQVAVAYMRLTHYGNMLLQQDQLVAGLDMDQKRILVSKRRLVDCCLGCSLPVLESGKKRILQIAQQIIEHKCIGKSKKLESFERQGIECFCGGQSGSLALSAHNVSWPFVSFSIKNVFLRLVRT